MSEYYGCGDSGCIFGHQSGMATNGGCNCLDMIRNSGERWHLTKAIRSLRTENAALKARVERVEAAARNVFSGWKNDDELARALKELRAALEEP